MATPSRGTVTGEPRVIGPGFRDRVYEVVKTVPKGAVTTYGDVGGALGSRRVARQVGFALAALTKPAARSVPWHRVINSTGRISFRGDIERAGEQQRLLEREGVRFDDAGKVVDFAARRHAFAAPSSSTSGRAREKKRGREVRKR